MLFFVLNSTNVQYIQYISFFKDRYYVDLQFESAACLARRYRGGRPARKSPESREQRIRYDAQTADRWGQVRGFRMLWHILWS